MCQSHDLTQSITLRHHHCYLDNDQQTQQTHGIQHINSPLGQLQAQWILSDHAENLKPHSKPHSKQHWALCRLDFINAVYCQQTASPHIINSIANPATELIEQMDNLEHQLRQYFTGHRQTFDIPLLLQGTVFQKRVWQELQRIAYGQTISYAKQALRIGKPTATRAVANANGKNPISIIIPCHRVIRSDGSLGGYTGGIDKKQALLKIET
ncbi:methylated-DNA--[protein]-cysteine S-methyltransferase [Moraxella lincolnii]|uniref:methylated-DNA--[protein]-cysteine S-methyltransferase n=1 Tax=Lwoffella lincolnii TaxID=90241 RepID=UPI0030D5E939